MSVKHEYATIREACLQQAGGNNDPCQVALPMQQKKLKIKK